MAELQSSLPVVELGSGCSVVLEALDPLDGTPVVTVTVANVAITYEAPGSVTDAAPLPGALTFAPSV